jgi:predicted ATPase/DNA-binding SARP family transcriptional activator
MPDTPPFTTRLKGVRFGVLGPVGVWTDGGEPVTIPGRKVRALLADLLVSEGHPVPVDRLVDDLWGEAVPANPAAVLQVRVSQLRRALDEAEPGGRELVVSQAPGYLLRAPAGAVDAGRFADLTDRARAAEDPRTRAALLADALALWRGPAYADFADEPFTRAAIARLEEQRLAVLELHAEARLALGDRSDHGDLAHLADLVASHPYRERLRAAQMRALYRAGRQSEALASYDDLRRRLADELGLDPSPELVALHKAILDQDPGLAAPRAPVAAPAPITRPTTNLPEPLTELIGRDEAVAEVRSLVSTRRLVTLTGSGGVGKTRLAVAAARALVDTFPDGAWLVELAALERPGAVAELVMSTLDIHDTGAPAGDRLAEAVRGRKLLLVLDNCEHLVAEAAGLAESLLRAAPGLRILATSREPLGLAGELLWEVPPLVVPDARADPASLAQASAVRLFAARAAAAQRGFTVDAGTGPAVAELCRRLDGIPLALELAATRVRALGVSELLARLRPDGGEDGSGGGGLRLLATGPRDAPARQRTLTAVIDWSWRLLTEPERVVFRRLAVHADGCTLAAAEAVCADETLPATEVLDLLTRLVDKSLVTVDTDGPRYRLLESVAAYCIERLHEAEELATVRRRHADYYLALAERAEPYLYGHRQREWLRRLDAEVANLRAALDTMADPEPALRLVNALAWYWFLRGRLSEAHRSLAAALAVPGDPPAALHARALAWQAGIALLHGDTDGWVQRQQAVLERYEEVDDPAGLARARWFLASAMIDLGDLAAAEDLLRRALRTFRERGDRWGEAAALGTLAKLAHPRGDLAALGRDGRRSAQLFRELGDQWGLLQATDWLGGLAELTGDYEEAIRLNRDGLRMAEELGLWPDAAGRLSWIGWIAVQLGDYQQAREYAEQGLRLAAEQGYQAVIVLATIALGFAARRDGKLDLAEEHLRGLLALAREQESDGNHPLFQAMVLTELGSLASQRGDPEAALRLHQEGFDVARTLGSLRGMAWSLTGMAAVLTVDGGGTDAARLLGAAATARRTAGLPLSPSDRDELSRITAAVRAAVGETGFQAGFASGGELTVEQARSLVDKDRARD